MIGTCMECGIFLRVLECPICKQEICVRHLPAHNKKHQEFIAHTKAAIDINGGLI